jgi:hypothetical protein
MQQICNPFDNSYADPIQNELRKASDYFPVTLDIE